MKLVTIKENAALFAGILLPLLLILFVWFSQKIAEISVPAPLYPLVLCEHDGYFGDDLIDVQVENGQITAQAKAPKDGTPTPNAKGLIFVYVNAATGEKKTAKLVLPVNMEPGSKINIPIPAPFATLKIHEGDISPDGYRVENVSDQRAGITGEFFGGRHRDKIILSKKGRNIEIHTKKPYWNATKILGWAAP